MDTSEQLKEEIKNKLLPALKSVLDARGSGGGSKEVFHIDKDDKRDFFKAITIEQIECTHYTVVNASRKQETNDTETDHQFPERTTKGSVKEEQGGKASARIGDSQAGVEGELKFSSEKKEEYNNSTSPVPAQSIRMHVKGTTLLTHRVHISVQADCLIRVYSHTPVRRGAAIGGGVGAGAGAAGGTAGGVAIGALIGSIVPVAGTIVGGVIGGIIGAVGGGVVIGGAGAGLGAGSGAIHSNRVHGTVCAYKVFQKLSNFSYDKNNNSCRCTIIVNTVCPADYQNLERI